MRVNNSELMAKGESESSNKARTSLEQLYEEIRNFSDSHLSFSPVGMINWKFHSVDRMLTDG
jgi:hypothetical protein